MSIDSSKELSQIRGAERDAAKKYVGSRGPISKATRKLAVSAARRLPKGRARNALQEVADANAPSWYDRLEQRRAANLAAWLAGTLTDDQLIEASPDELPHDPQIVQARQAAFERRADQRAESIYRDSLEPRVAALPIDQRSILEAHLEHNKLSAEEAHHALNFAQAIRALDGESADAITPLMEGINYAAHGGKYLHSLLENRDPENLAASRAAQVMAKRIESDAPHTAELFRNWSQSIQSQWDGGSFNQDAGDQVEQQRKLVLDSAQTLGFVPSADDYESVTKTRHKQATELKLAQERAARERAEVDFAANMVAKNTMGKKQEKLLAKLQKEHGLSEYQASQFSTHALSSVLANPKQKWSAVVEDAARRIRQNVPASMPVEAKRLYHRTPNQFDAFGETPEASVGMNSIGHWFAETPHLGSGKRVIEADVSIRNPLQISTRENAEKELLIAAYGKEAGSNKLAEFERLREEYKEGVIKSVIENGGDEDKDAANRQMRELFADAKGKLRSQGYDGLHIASDMGFGSSTVAFAGEQVSIRNDHDYSSFSKEDFGKAAVKKNLKAESPATEVETREQAANRKHVKAMREQLEMEQRQHPGRFAEDWLLDDPTIDEIHRGLLKSNDTYRELSNRADKEVESIDTSGLADGDYPKVPPVEFERQKQLAQEHLNRFPEHTPEFAVQYYGLNLPADVGKDQKTEQQSGTKQEPPISTPIAEKKDTVATDEIRGTLKGIGSGITDGLYQKTWADLESGKLARMEKPPLFEQLALMGHKAGVVKSVDDLRDISSGLLGTFEEQKVAGIAALNGLARKYSGESLTASAPEPVTDAPKKPHQLPAYYHQEIQGRTLAELLDMRDWPRDKVPPQYSMKAWKTEMRGRIQDWVKTEQDRKDVNNDGRDTQETLAAIVGSEVPAQPPAIPPSEPPKLGPQPPELSGLTPESAAQSPKLEPKGVTTSPQSVTASEPVTLPPEAPTPVDSVPVATPETPVEKNGIPTTAPAAGGAQPQSIPQHGTPPEWSKEQRESDKKTLLEYLQTSPGVSVHAATQIPGLSPGGARRRNVRELLTEMAVDGTVKQERTGLTRQVRYSLSRDPQPVAVASDWTAEHQANDLRVLRDQSIHSGQIDAGSAMGLRGLSTKGHLPQNLAKSLQRLEEFEVLERINQEQRGSPQYRPTKAARMEAAAERVKQPLPDQIEYKEGARWAKADYQKDMQAVVQQVLTEGTVDLPSLQRNKQLSMHGGTDRGMQRLLEDMQAAGGIEEAETEQGKPQRYQLTTAAIEGMKAEYQRSLEPASTPAAAGGQGVPPRKPPEAPPAAPLPPDDSDPKRRPSFEVPPTPEEVASAEILETLAGNPLERNPIEPEVAQPRPAKPTDSKPQPTPDPTDQQPKPAEQPAPKQGKLRSFADKIQLGLDIAGAIDPTPAFDTGNTMISLMRGLVTDRKRRDHHLQNAAISAAGAFWPGIGDLAKLMKVGRTEPAQQAAKQAKAGYQQTQEAIKQERRTAAASAVASVSAPAATGGGNGQPQETQPTPEAKASESQQTSEAAIASEPANGTQVDVPGRQVPSDSPSSVPGSGGAGEASEISEQAPGGSSGLMDKLQLGLDAVGVADPTPIADGANAAISLFRGMITDPKRRGFHLKNAAISVAGAALPYVGDLAKAGKLGKLASGSYGAKALGAAETAVGNAKRKRSATAETALDAQAANSGAGGGSNLPPANSPGQAGGNTDELADSTEKLTEGFGGLLKKLGPFGDVVGTASMAMGAFAARAIRYTTDFGKENDQVLDGLRPLSKMNANVASSFAQADLREFQREIKRSAEIAPQVSQVNSSQSDLKDVQSQFSVPLEKLALEIRGLKAGIVSGIANGMNELTGASGKLETVSGYLVDAIKSIRDWLGIKESEAKVMPAQDFLRDIADGKFDGKAPYLGVDGRVRGSFNLENK
jgi:hypothetical protein